MRCSVKFQKIHRKTPAPPATLLKRNPGTCVFLWIFFCRTPLDGCFHNKSDNMRAIVNFSKTYFIQSFMYLRVRSHERRNELITGLRFQTGVKTSYVHMKFHFGCISKRPNILIDTRTHFISGSVYMILYRPKWNFISVKMTDRKVHNRIEFQTHMRIKRNIQQACAYSFRFK